MGPRSSRGYTTLYSPTMAARRHLPVLASTPPAPTPAPAESAQEDPPPWHWIPLGTTVSVLAFALLAQGAAALSVKILAHAFGPSASASHIAAVRAAHPTSATLAVVGASAVSIAALKLSIGLGGYFIGRYGPHTNARHGTLSGALTALLFWAVTGRLWSMLAMVPLGMLVGWAGAYVGARTRARSTADSAL